MDFNDWLSSLPGAPTPTLAANKSGLTNTTLIRHAARGHTTADNVIAISRAYGVSPVEALVSTGHLNPDEASSERIDVRVALRAATIQEKWDSIADDIDSMQLVVGRFPRAAELDISQVYPRGYGRQVEDAGLTSDIDQDDGTVRRASVSSTDDLIDSINANEEQFAAQPATDPLEENQP